MSEDISKHNSDLPSILNQEEYNVFITKYCSLRYSKLEKLGNGPEWQTDEEAEFQKRSFPNFTTFNYVDKFIRIKSLVNVIKESNDFSISEKISLLENYNLYLTTDSSNNPIRKALRKLYEQICEEYSIDFDHILDADKCFDRADEALQRGLDSNTDYLWLKDFDAMIRLNDTQTLAGRMLIRETITELTYPDINRSKRKPKQNKFSLSQTVYIFDLLRDIELISSSVTNKAISESIQELTGFSSKQAINQFGENADQEVHEKLKSETIELLEKLLNRLR